VALTHPLRISQPSPTLEVERTYFSPEIMWVIGCDEVGRGALAGPVAVGLAVGGVHIGPVPQGLRDSKLLSELQREAMAPRVSVWLNTHAVGVASAAEIDRWGIIRAMGLAGERAVKMLHEEGIDLAQSVVLLDGNHDYLSSSLYFNLRVETRVKADRDCALVSAASVIAKVHRDRLMIDASGREPHFGWKTNKGYGTAEHRAAILTCGTSELHRKTWLTSLT
jgi:ribonuclease HII